MLAIHGIWAYGVLGLWAEDPDGPPSSPPRPGRASRAPRPHPFAAAAEVIADVVAGLAEPAADLARKAVEDELTLWLPATADGPLASPELIRAPDSEPARNAGRGMLTAWRVHALSFEPSAALELLSVLGEAGTLGEQAVQGGSVRYLEALAQVAGDLAARGRVLPGLARDDGGASDGGASDGGASDGGASDGGVDHGGIAAPGGDGGSGGYAARWWPVLSGADAQRARDLAAAMPPLCRATTAGGASSALVLTEALDALTDAAARASLSSQPGFGLLPASRGRRPARIPVAERWAAALASVNPQVTVLTPEDEAEAAALAADLTAWRSTAQAPAGPVRTCFRLVEPAEAATGGADGDRAGDGAGDDGAGHDRAAAATGIAAAVGAIAATGDEAAVADPPWAVELALQSTEDPSLLLPAADVWSGASAGGWAMAGIRHPEEELLAGLGRASRLFPELDDELHSAAPDTVTLDTPGAFRFLRETGPLLSGAGFGVLLPDWARKARLGLKMTTRSKQAAASDGAAQSMFGLADLVDFRYELALGDQTLDSDELAELARLKVPLVRLRGQWVELDDRHLQAALKFLARRSTGTMPAADALLAGLRGLDDDLPVVGVDADGWLGDLLSGHADQRLAPASTPASFRGELRPYQERGLAWLSFLGNLGLGGILADDMGLGKTVELLGLMAHERTSPDAPPGPTLLVCPMSVVGNWQQEAARFTPDLRVHVHHGADRLTGPELAEALNAADLVITTYALVARDRDALSGIGWRRVVCDEAQNIKNSATRQAQAVRNLPAGSRIALTGTPVENRLAELWSIMEFTSPGLLGPAAKFRTAYAVPIERSGDAEAIARLKRITGPFILRRLKTDKTIISDLPDKLEMKIWCNLTPEQASLYQATVTDMLAKIEAAEGIERRGLVLATMAKLKQACNHPAHLLGDGSRLDGRSGKLARLEEICDEVVAVGEKALCFTQYAEFGRMLQPYLAGRLGCPVLYLHGGTPKKQRDAMVSRFQAITDPAVFILSLKAGGTGLNLTAANHVIHVDRWWNPAVEDQATDRAFRIGQRKDVQVRKFVCVGTVEERIDAMIEEKKALAERIVGTGEGWLTELSVAELRKVIALSPEAVSE